MSKTTHDQKIRNLWTRRVEKALLGKKITKIEYLSNEEVENNMWYKTPVAIQLDNKYWLIPMADDEGNNGGSISTTIKDLPVIPVI